ncbi:MAG: hypothetical protein DSM106950_02005 [Stigonema ocellatum SAG 48.90 = DSM 106950]|nr:hypothetical protein [Stigonema ocellatum SAG 48.90 = DSM 106950]
MQRSPDRTDFRVEIVESPIPHLVGIVNPLTAALKYFTSDAQWATLNFCEHFFILTTGD